METYGDVWNILKTSRLLVDVFVDLVNREENHGDEINMVPRRTPVTVITRRVC